MNDDLRTAIQDCLCDFVLGSEFEDSEEAAEGLVDYLAERGWEIVDSVTKRSR